MQSYIDVKYLTHFFNSLIESNEFSMERSERMQILEFFKGKSDLILDKDFNELLDGIEKSKRDVVRNLLNNLNTGRNGTIIKTKNSNMSYNLKKLDVFSRIKEPFASFWVDEHQTKFDCDKYMSANPYCFLSKKNELEEWKNMNQQKSFYVGPSKNDEANVLGRWDQIKKNQHAFRDFLLVDRYCLMDKDRIKKNIIPLIVNLAKFPEIVKNVLIFIQGKDQLYSNTLKDAQEYISELLQKEGLKNAAVAIYLCYDRAPHDRCAITNNKYITSGDSFDYFNQNGSFKTKGTTLTIEPVYSSNKSAVSKTLNKLKEIVLNAKDLNSYGKITTNLLNLI